MRRYTCVVCSTTGPSISNHITFHTFPRKQSRRDLWCQILQLPRVTDQNRICSKHFSKNDFFVRKDNRRMIRASVVPMRYNETTAQNTMSPIINISQDYEEPRMLEIVVPSTANTSHITSMRTLEPMQTTSTNSNLNNLIVEVLPTSCAYISNLKTIFSYDDIDVINVNGDTDDINVDGDTDVINVNGDIDVVNFNGDTDGINVNGDTDGINVNGDTDGINVNGDTDGINVNGDTDDILSELLKMYFDTNQVNDILQDDNFSDISKSKEALFKYKNIILSLCQDNSVLQQKIKILEYQYQSAVNMVKELGGHIVNDPTIHHD